MKRPTIHRARTTWIRTAAKKIAGCALASWLLLGNQSSRAQEPLPPLPPLPSVTNEPELAISSRLPNRPLPDVPPPDRAVPAVFQTVPPAPPTPLAPIADEQFTGIQQIQGQFRPRDKDRDSTFTVPLEFPGAENIFRRDSDADFRERIRQEAMADHTKIIFPEEIPVSTESYQRRQFRPMVRGVEPSYVCHGRLFFEQPNFERQGWDLGVLTPVVNLGVYYYDLALLPYHAWTRPFEHTDCSAGKCLPGDPTPLYLYHGEFSVTGLVGQAGVVTGLFYLFP